MGASLRVRMGSGNQEGGSLTPHLVSFTPPRARGAGCSFVQFFPGGAGRVAWQRGGFAWRNNSILFWTGDRPRAYSVGVMESQTKLELALQKAKEELAKNYADLNTRYPLQGANPIGAACVPDSEQDTHAELRFEVRVCKNELENHVKHYAQNHG